MNRALCVLSLCLVACTGPIGGGTAVGNPPSALLRTASTAGVEVMGAELEGATLEITPCDANEPISSLFLGDIDVVDAPDFALPSILPCGALLIADRLELEAFEDTAREIEVELVDVEIALGPTFETLSGGRALAGIHVLELGQPEWLMEIAEPGLEDDLVIGPDDPRHTTLQGELSAGSALWRDLDASAQVEEIERDVAVLAAWEAQVAPR